MTLLSSLKYLFYFLKSLLLKILHIFSLQPLIELSYPAPYPLPQVFTILVSVSMGYACMHTGSLVHLFSPTHPHLLSEI